MHTKKKGRRCFICVANQEFEPKLAFVNALGPKTIIDDTLGLLVQEGTFMPEDVTSSKEGFIFHI